MQDKYLIWAVLIMVLSGVSVITNIIQLIVIHFRRKKKSIFDVSVISLSTADMLASAMFVLQGLRRFLTKQGMPVNSVLLRFAYTGCYFSVSSSCLHIIFIAVQRMISIRYPMKSKGWLTFRRALLAILLLWFLSAIFACLSGLRLFSSHAMSYYIFISGAVIVTAYLSICCEMMKRQSVFTATVLRSTESSSEVVLIHSFVIMFTFVFCTFPYAVARFFSHKSVVYIVCDIIFALNPLLDPVLYFFLSFLRRRINNNTVTPKNCNRNEALRAIENTVAVVTSTV